MYLNPALPWLSCQIVLASCLISPAVSCLFIIAYYDLDQVLPLDIFSRPVILYLCLLDYFSGLTSLPVTGLVVCLWTLYFCLELLVKLFFFATLRESAFGSLPARDHKCFTVLTFLKYVAKISIEISVTHDVNVFFLFFFNVIQVKDNLQITVFNLNINLAYCPNLYWFGIASWKNLSD